MSRTRSPRARLALAVVYLALAVAGLVGTWAFNIAFFVDTAAGRADGNYVAGWFANAAAGSAAMDILVMAAAASVLMIVEGARLGWARWAWVFVPLSFAVAVAFAFPLFLGMRELALRRREPAAG